jgi:hypothetical protein
VKPGRVALCLCALGVLALAPSPADAAVTIGETFTPGGTSDCNNGFSWIGDPSPAPPAAQYSAPSGGVITSWSFEAGATGTPQVRLKVYRPTGVSEEFVTVGRSGHEHPFNSITNTYETRIPVKQGDLIGIYGSGSSFPCIRPLVGFGVHTQFGDTPLGTTETYVSIASAQLDVAAQLEPDADGDGFGDETQDQCPADPSVQAAAGSCPVQPVPDRTPPQTALNGVPKKKSKSKKATLSFSSEPGATFRCSLDGNSFSDCTSPLSVKAALGRHSFVVFAKDAAGNVDDSPATASWTVKKRK